MTRRARSRFTTLAGTGTVLAAVIATMAGTAVAATSSTPTVVNRESVEVQADASGHIDKARLFSQLSITGNGRVVVADPTSTKELRNLDGFEAPKVVDGHAVWDITVNGESHRRTVSTVAENKLPVTITAKYFLNGKPMSPSDVVGKSGKLTATYTVSNVTAKPGFITYQDGSGRSVTKLVKIVMPLVGQLGMTLPHTFRDIVSPKADLAGDGRGNTQLLWSMVLFNPVGELNASGRMVKSTTQVFSYTAQVTDAALPEVTLMAAPVPPAKKPEIRVGEHGTKAGAASAQQITYAGTAIGENLTKLADGTSQLMAGLEKLYAGALALHAGLGAAVNGSAQLSAGIDTAAGKTAAGFKALVPGVDALAGGAMQLDEAFSDPTGQNPDLTSGSQKLSDSLALYTAGVKQLADGLAQFAGDDGLPAEMAQGAVQLKDAINTGLETVLGSDSQLAKGVDKLLYGLDHDLNWADPDATAPVGIKQGVECVQQGVRGLKSGSPAVPPGVSQCAPTGVDAAPGGLEAAADSLANLKSVVDTQITTLTAALVSKGITPSPSTCAALVDQVEAAACGTVLHLTDVSTNLEALQVGATRGVETLTTLDVALTQMLAGLGDRTTSGETVLYGLAALGAGLGTAKTNIQLGISAAIDIYVSSVAAAVQELFGSNGLIGAGVSQLVDNADPLAAGGKDLAAGIDKAGAGAHKIAGGLGQVQSGVRDFQSGLNDGFGQLSAGGQQLAAGLPAAQDGAGQIADGLGQAKGGATKIRDGQNQLNAQAAKPLEATGNETAVTYGAQYAMLRAMDGRATTGGMAYGAPVGASGSTAYLFTLAAATHDSTDSSRNVLLAIGVLALASVIGVVLRRRLFA